MSGSFGKGAKRAAEGAVPEPTPKLTKRGPVPIADLNVSAIKVGPVENGGQGDKFCRVFDAEGGRVILALDKHPTWGRAPFDAGPPKTADGKELGPQWGWVVELKQEAYDKMVELQEHVIKLVSPVRNDLLPNEAKKRKGGMTDEQFADKFNSKLTPANPAKGYAASMRIFIESDPSKQMPKIQLMHKKGDKYTRPRPGTIHDLKRGSACVVAIGLVRGFYAGQTGLGCGMKFAAVSIDIIENLRSENPNQEMDYSEIEFLDEDTPDDGVQSAKCATTEDTQGGGGGGGGAGDQFEDPPGGYFPAVP